MRILSEFSQYWRDYLIISLHSIDFLLKKRKERLNDIARLVSVILDFQNFWQREKLHTTAQKHVKSRTNFLKNILSTHIRHPQNSPQNAEHIRSTKVLNTTKAFCSDENAKILSRNPRWLALTGTLYLMRLQKMACDSHIILRQRRILQRRESSEQQPHFCQFIKNISSKPTLRRRRFALHQNSMLRISGITKNM